MTLLGIDLQPWQERILAELYYAFPQRVMLGIPSKEDTLGTYNGLGGATTNVTRSTRNHSVLRVTGVSGRTETAAIQGVEDHAKLALDLLVATKGLFDGPYRTTDNGKATIEAGNARVYEAMTEGEAERNLNFALANLRSYVEWNTTGRKAKEKRDAELAAAVERQKREAEEKRQREMAEAKKRVEEEKRRIDYAALDLYNAAHKRSAYNSWPPFMGDSQKEKWRSLARSAESIKKAESSPYAIGGLISGGGISATTIRANDLYPSSLFNSRIW